MMYLKKRLKSNILLFMIFMFAAILFIGCKSSITGKAAASTRIINSAPEISCPSEINVNEGQMVDVNATIIDLNGDDTEVYYSSPLNSTGEWKTRYDSAGVYDAYVTASDSEETTSCNFTITVDDVYKPINVAFSIINVLQDEFEVLFRDSGYKFKGSVVNQTTTTYEIENRRLNKTVSADTYTVTINMTGIGIAIFGIYPENSTDLSVYLDNEINLVPPSNVSFKNGGFAFEPLFDIGSAEICFDTNNIKFINETRKSIFKCQWNFGSGKCIGQWGSVAAYEDGSSICHNATEFSAFVLGETLGYYCGDSTCNPTESCSSCSADCGSCIEKAIVPSKGGGGAPSGGPASATERPAKPSKKTEEIWGGGKPLLDIILKILDPYATVNIGEPLFVEVLLYNFGSTKRVDAELIYSINDSDNNEVYRGYETLAVETSLSKLKQFKAPNKPGNYTIIVEAVYGTTKAMSTAAFEVVEPPTIEIPGVIPPIINMYLFFIIAALIVIMFFMVIYEHSEIKKLGKITKRLSSEDFVRKGFIRNTSVKEHDANKIR